MCVSATERQRHCIKEGQTNWDDRVPFVMYVYSSTEQPAIGCTSVEVICGHQCTLRSALRSDPSPKYSCDVYVAELKVGYRHNSRS